MCTLHGTHGVNRRYFAGEIVGDLCCEVFSSGRVFLKAAKCVCYYWLVRKPRRYIAAYARNMCACMHHVCVTIKASTSAVVLVPIDGTCASTAFGETELAAPAMTNPLKNTCLMACSTNASHLFSTEGAA